MLHTLSKNEKRLAHIVNSYFKHYCEQNTESILSLFSNQKAIFIGIGSDEKAIGKEAISLLLQKHFSQGKATHYEIHYDHISITDELTFITGDVSIKIAIDQQEMVLNPRLTTLLINNHNEWSIQHMHLSLPSPFQKIGSAYPNI